MIAKCVGEMVNMFVKGIGYLVCVFSHIIWYGREDIQKGLVVCGHDGYLGGLWKKSSSDRESVGSKVAEAQNLWKLPGFRS